MSVQMLLGYPYWVFRPVRECSIRTGEPEFAFSLTSMVTTMVRPPLFGSGSSAKAATVGGFGGFGWFTMFSATTRQVVMLLSTRQVVAQSRRWSSPVKTLHCTQRFPGFRMLALVWV